MPDPSAPFLGPSDSVTLELTQTEAEAIVVALELRRLNQEWHSSRLRDAAAHAEAKAARALRALKESTNA